MNVGKAAMKESQPKPSAKFSSVIANARPPAANTTLLTQFILCLEAALRARSPESIALSMWARHGVDRRPGVPPHLWFFPDVLRGGSRGLSPSPPRAGNYHKTNMT
jgi:hypothetical protein